MLVRCSANFLTWLNYLSVASAFPYSYISYNAFVNDAICYYDYVFEAIVDRPFDTPGIFAAPLDSNADPELLSFFGVVFVFTSSMSLLSSN